ncbi:MAG: TAXI family TRAP transporter solute-binding subunit [Longimicrobiales bacterium]
MKRPGRLGAWKLCTAAVVLAMVACSGQGQKEFRSLGTAGTGGIYYPLGGALASHMTLADSIRQYTAEVSGGSVENISRLQSGQIDLAFALGNTIYESFSGGQDYDTPVSDLRILAPLYPNVTHIVVAEASSAQSVADLAGGTVSVGPPGSGTEQMSRQILEAYGLDYEMVTARYLSFSESATALKDGAVDAAIISVGYPAAAVLEATTTAGSRILPMDAETVASLQEKYPYYIPGTIPAGSYPGVEEDIPTAAIYNWVIAMESLDPGVVETLLTVVVDGRERLEQVHDMAKQMDMGLLGDAPIPLHESTAAWFRENGGGTP